MVFSSPVFLFLFLPVVLLLALVLKDRKLQNYLLLLSSLYFYAWGETIYVMIMLISILVNYTIGTMIGVDGNARSRNAALGSGIVFNLGLLIFFKYANFLADQANLVLDHFSVPLIELEQVHLPIGISFFTFQSMSYIVDVHRRTVEPQRNVLDLALYISFFPQLIAGPIVRYHDLVDQLTNRKIELPLFASGIQRFIIGLAKKVIIADTLAYIADQIFAIPTTELPFDVAWLGIICYTLQIYFDFSGYSDMAIGLGRMFGFKFLENFNFPYIARSIKEFWRRWHISLSNWFRDYLYIPLGGNRGNSLSTYRNLFIVFFLTGLWHGASWNFIVWGLIHGVFLVLERIGLGRVLEKAWRPLGHLYTLLIVILAWVFFRAETLTGAMEFCQSLVGLEAGNDSLYFASYYLDKEVVVILILGMVCSAPVSVYLEKLASVFAFRNVRIVRTMKFSGLMVLFLLSCMYMATTTYSPFIYFRF